MVVTVNNRCKHCPFLSFFGLFFGHDFMDIGNISEDVKNAFVSN